MALLPAGRAGAHDVEAAITTAIRVEFFFADGTPATGFAVTATYEDGEEEDLGKTDPEGTIVFRPAQRGACELYAESAGHGKKVVISADVIAEVATRPASQSAAGFGPSKRRAIPLPMTEALASVAFVAVLSLVTYVLLRRAGRAETDITDNREVFRREVEALRATVQRLEQERNAP